MDIFTHTLEQKIPLAVQVDLTRQCNLHFIHCCIEERGDIDKGDEEKSLGI